MRTASRPHEVIQALDSCPRPQASSETPGHCVFNSQRHLDLTIIPSISINTFRSQQPLATDHSTKMRSTIIFVLAFTSAVLAVPTRTGRDTFCQAMCYPFEPTCETGMVRQIQPSSISLTTLIRVSSFQRRRATTATSVARSPQPQAMFLRSQDLLQSMQSARQCATPSSLRAKVAW